MYGGVIESLAGLDCVGSSHPGNFRANAGRIGDQAIHDFGVSLVCDNVGSASTGNGANIERGRAEKRINGERKGADFVKGIKERVDGGVPEFGIGRVSELAVRGEFIAKNAFRAQSEFVFGGFAVDEETRAAGRCGGDFGTDAAALFADDKQKAKLRVPEDKSDRAAATMAAMMPLASQEPRPWIKVSSSREGKNGGTVSRCVERVTTGSPKERNRLSRSGSALCRSRRAW